MKILGIDMGGTNLRGALVQGGQIGRVDAVALRSGGQENEILEQVYALIDVFHKDDIDGIGIGVPSVVDVERGIVYDVVNIPSWKAVPVKEFLEKRYRVPVFVNNDANCFAIGETYFGKGRGHQSVVGLILGTGMGSGLIVNGKLYSGRNCGAGEFGMIPWKDGVLENFCSGQFFRRSFNRSGEQLLREALEGSRQAKEAFSEFGQNLGKALEIVVLALDPEIIILGGSVCKSFEFFRDAMWHSLASFPYPQTLRRLVIDVSETEHIAILGAAALVFDALGKDFPP